MGCLVKHRDSVHSALYEAFSDVKVVYKVKTKQGDTVEEVPVQFNCNISLSSLTDAWQLQFVERLLTMLNSQKQHRRQESCKKNKQY